MTNDGEPTSRHDGRPTSVSRRTLAIVLTAGALTVAGQLLLEQYRLIGLVPVMVGLLLWAPEPAGGRQSPRPTTTVLVLVAAFMVAAHFLGLRHFPPGVFFDEAVNLTEAKGLLDPFRFEVWSYAVSGRPTLFLYLIGLAGAAFDHQWLAARAFVALVSVLTVGTMVWALEPALGRRRAALAALVFGLTAFHLLFARIIYEASISTLFLLLAVGAAVRAMAGRGFRWWLLWGAALGLGLWTYNAFRLVPVLFTIAVAGWALATRRRLLPVAAGIAAGALVALVVVSPMVPTIVHGFGDFTFRAAELSVFKEAREAGSWQPLWRNLAAYALLFVANSGESNQIYKWPGLSPPSAVLFWIGLGVAIGAIARRRGGQPAIMLFWLAAALLPGLLTLSIEAPHWCRSLYALPAAAVVLTYGLDRLAGLFRGRWKSAAISALLVIVAGGEWWAFQNRIAGSREVFNFFYPTASTAAFAAAKLAAAGGDVLVSDDFATVAYEEQVFWSIAGERGGPISALSIWRNMPRPECERPTTAVLATRDLRLVNLFNELFPGSTVEEIHDPWGGHLRHEVRVACEETQSAVEHGGLLVRRTGTYDVAVVGDAEIHLESHRLSDGDRFQIPAGIWAVQCRPNCSEIEARFEGPESFSLRQAVVSAPAPGRGLTAHYVNSDGSESTQLDRLIFANQRGIQQHPFRTQWTGLIEVPETGTYEFGMEADDVAELVINGQSILRYPYDEGYYHDEASVDLAEGPHEIRIEYAKIGGGLTMEITWKPPWEEGFMTIPAAQFVPLEWPTPVEDPEP
jgi:4-amino-4-deoxy-L-arabinose transferase-like glycosyltransferase